MMKMQEAQVLPEFDAVMVPDPTFRFSLSPLSTCNVVKSASWDNGEWQCYLINKPMYNCGLSSFMNEGVLHPLPHI